MEQIIYRPYKKQDFGALSEIINITWEHEKNYSQSTAIRLSNAYLRICLAEQTFTQVAVCKGKAVGIIMGNNLHCTSKPLIPHLQAKKDMLILSMTSEGRRAAHFFEELDKIYGRLLSAQSRQYGGELSFFAIHPNYRGLGIGKELYYRFQNYMDSVRIEDFYVFTDTTCNYGFYEHQGMIRCGTEKITIPVNGKQSDFLFFIYENSKSVQTINETSNLSQDKKLNNRTNANT